MCSNGIDTEFFLRKQRLKLGDTKMFSGNSKFLNIL